MNDAIIIQHAYENTPYHNLLKITAPRIVEYCLLHKTDFELVINGEVTKNGDWAKVPLIRSALEVPQYKYVIYLDPDTVIVDMTADLRDGCPPEKIGLCRHVLTSPPYSAELDHLNIGAIYLSNCEAVKQTVDRWLAGYPGMSDPPWWEQGVLAEVGSETVVEIDAKWNATGKVNPSPNPVVLGFHGQGDVKQRFDDMCRAIGK